MQESRIQTEQLRQSWIHVLSCLTILDAFKAAELTIQVCEDHDWCLDEFANDIQGFTTHAQ